MDSNQIDLIPKSLSDNEENKLDKLERKIDSLFKTIEKIQQQIDKITVDYDLMKEKNPTCIGDSIKLKLDDLEKKILSLSKFCETFQDNFSSALSGGKTIKDGLEAFYKKYSKNLPDFYYNNDFERRRGAEFNNIEQMPGYEEMFKKLISGLSEIDADTLVSMLKKKQRVAQSALGSSIEIYNSKEKKEIQELTENFKPKIYTVSNNLFCYKNYLLPINHFEPSVFYDKHGIGRLNEKSLNQIRNRNIIDVGGFIGDSVLILAPFTDKKVYTFEPASKNFDYLKKTLELNDIKNAVAENFALGESEGYADIYIMGSCTSMQELVGLETECVERVKVETLDDYVLKNKIEVGLIKVDVEGAEQSFLKGAEETIKKQRPVLLLSIYHSVSDFFNIKPLIESWNLGYKFKIHKPVDYSIAREVLLICEQE